MSSRPLQCSSICGISRQASQTSLALLKDDGVLLFEVPLLSKSHDNKIWFTSSLEHVYYPTERGIRRLIAEEFGLRLVGCEIHVRDYASTYVGIVAKNVTVADSAARLLDRLIQPDGELSEPKERKARLQLSLVHAANSSPTLVADLDVLPSAAFTLPLVKRLAQIWATDIRKREHATTAAAEETKTRDWFGGQLEQLRIANNELTKSLERMQNEQTHAAARLYRAEAETLLKAAENERSQAQATLAMARVERAETQIAVARREAQVASDALVAAQSKKDMLAAEVSVLEARLCEAQQTSDARLHEARRPPRRGSMRRSRPLTRSSMRRCRQPRTKSRDIAVRSISSRLIRRRWHRIFSSISRRW